MSMDSEDLYNRKRMHDLSEKVAEISMLSNVHAQDIKVIEEDLKVLVTKDIFNELRQELKSDIRALEETVKKMVACGTSTHARIDRMESQLKTYNRFMWLLLSTALTFLTMWYFK